VKNWKHEWTWLKFDLYKTFFWHSKLYKPSTLRSGIVHFSMYAKIMMWNLTYLTLKRNMHRLIIIVIICNAYFYNHLLLANKGMVHVSHLYDSQNQCRNIKNYVRQSSITDNITFKYNTIMLYNVYTFGISKW